MELKRCNICDRAKDIEEFRRNTGLKNKFNKSCRKCIEAVKARNDANYEQLKDYQKQYREANKEKMIEYRRKWNSENRELAAKHKNDLYANNPAFKARTLTRAKTRGLIEKAFEFELFFGCSFEQFKVHIESKWQEGMNWSNYGRNKGNWNIDHIIPLDGVNETLNSYTNLQPMWLEDNSRKGNKAL